jgi:Putative Ig domain
MAFRLVGSCKQGGSHNSVFFSKPFNTHQIGCVILAALSLVVVAGTNADALRAKFTAKSFATTVGFTIQANLPSGVVGVAYTGSVSASDGVKPYSFSIPEGSLPEGLSLNSTTGAVAGIPRVAGLFRAKIMARDAGGSVTWLHAQITIASGSTSSGVAITISPTTASLASGSIQHFTAMVSGTSYTSVIWSVTAGTISDGGSFIAPTVTRTTNVTVTATSAADTAKKASAIVTVSPSGSTTVSVVVSPGSATLTSGESQQFSAAVQGTGNTAVMWSATSGIVSSSGMFTAPAVTSNTSVTVTATSAADTTKKSSASVAVAPSTTTAALAITTSGLPGAQSGAAYAYPISATGGTLPYQWTVASGSLPPGFALSSTGQLAGTTTQTGTFTFTARVADAGNSATSKTFSLAVATPPPPVATGGTSGYDGPAELPRVYMQTTLADTPAPGWTIQVGAGGDLQAALNTAACGDTIELAAGATFAGVFTLPAKPCDDLHWIIIRTSAPDASLPPEGTRITPCYSGVASLPGRPAFNCASTQVATAKIIGGISGPIKLASGANHYRLLGLEITRTAGSGPNYGLIRPIGQADHIVVDRVWLHGTAQDETVVGWMLNGLSYAALVDSYATDFHCTTVTGSCTDSKVVAGGTSSTADGPYKVTDNFLEASGENILFGGGRATLTPADIEIRRNHFFKPLTWMQGQPGYVGGPTGNPFLVKNLLELKNAQRVLIEGNIFEYSWGGFSQLGYAILLTPKNQAGPNGTNLCPLCQVTDVTIRYNTISHTGAGVSIADVLSDNGGAALAGERYSIHDITLDDINASFYHGSGTLFQVYNAWPANVLNNLAINHITGFPDPGSRIIGLGNFANNPAMSAFSMKNSIVGQARYAIWSTGGTTNCAYYDVPLTSLNACFPTGYSFVDNAIIATSTVNFPPSKWPAGNYFPSSASAVQFVNFNNGNGGDYHLLSGSPYKNAATDGKDLGADVDTILSLTSGVY